MSKSNWKLLITLCAILVAGMFVLGCDDSEDDESKDTDTDTMVHRDTNSSVDTATTTPTDTGTGNPTDTGTGSPGDTDTVAVNPDCDTASMICTVSGTYITNQHWTANYAWVLRGGVFIGDDVNETILTIDPGTKIYGESATMGMLVIRRGSKIMAEGTKEAPIVFSSSKAPGARARGDWGGLIINGRASINGCDTAPCEASGEGGTGTYGGINDDDNSGVLKYVRVEFAGELITPDNELNGIAFQGVGRGTTVDYVQVHMNADDGVEFFGGTVRIKHVYLTGIGDDNLDWTDGWRGMAQFVIAEQYSDAGDQGIEADNNAENNALLPTANPMLSNVTLIGSGTDYSDIGMLIREGTQAQIYNTIVSNFAEGCIDIDSGSVAQAVAGNITFNNSVVNCAVNFVEDADETPVTVVSDTWNAGTGNAIAAAATEVLNGHFSIGTALGTGVTPTDAFFTPVNYKGAIVAEDNWLDGWTTTAQN